MLNAAPRYDRRPGTLTCPGEIPNPLEQISLEQLRKRTSMKWRTHPSDALPLWVAEMDVQLAPPISAALRQAIDTGDTGYPAGGEPVFAEAVSAFASRRWNWDGLAVENTSIVPDVMTGVVEVLRVITEPGDAVVVNSPVYSPFYAFVTHDARRIIEAPLGQDLRIDPETLEDAFRHARSHGRKAAYLLCNPHNPTGVVHSPDELATVVALSRKHGVRVISDEIHAPLVLPGAHFTPYLSVPGSENAFALTSASKGWNLSGLKAALAIAGPDAAHDLARLPPEVRYGPSHVGIIAHTAAFRDGDDWLDALLRGLASNRTLLGNLLDEHLPEVGYSAPEGTYLAWLDCSHLNIDSKSSTEGLVTSDLAGPARMFLDNARVAVSSGHVFGTGGAGHIRLNFATSQIILTEAITRMGQAVRAI